VNQIALKDPTEWDPRRSGLAPLEWNYFEAQRIELCVTPETAFEITGGASLGDLPYTGYRRFKKTEFFKSRPSSTTLSLNEQEANDLWNGTREILWPGIRATDLNHRQRADVSQLYFHTVTSGSTCANTAFLTDDHNFLNRRGNIQSGLGVAVMTADDAWVRYSDEYGLYHPTPWEIAQVHERQQQYITQLSTR
jgi:hypothetical protein